MNYPDKLIIGLANLWRMKLRSGLTILGVVIGIGALTSMIAFTSGIQKNITDTFEENDVFTSMYVTPVKADPSSIDLAETMKEGISSLDDDILDSIRTIEKVAIAHPEITFPARLKLKNKDDKTRIQALPKAMEQYKPYSDLLAGRFFSSDTAKELVINWRTLRSLGIIVKHKDIPRDFTENDSLEEYRILPPDSILGQTIELVSAKLDIGNVMKNPLKAATGTENVFTEESMPFTIVGILNVERNISAAGIKGGAIIPSETAKAIPRLDFTSVWDLLGNSGGGGQYSSIYVRVDDMQDLETVKKSLEDRGLNVFALADQLDQIRNAFLIMDAILGAIGAVALLIAALGIVNTMVMSILERTREIGIMKSIGASDHDIRTIFFAEAGSIGLVGGLFGILLGWAFAFAAQIVINQHILPNDELPVDLFYFPWWLVLGALAFGLLVSLTAGLYPAIRASRIDPVKALRHD
ncbi:MAG: ABC transporter permease [Bacteroidales bacterium]|nr:ABC transporter permease [Bacteroidales bacterium]